MLCSFECGEYKGVDLKDVFATRPDPCLESFSFSSTEKWFEQVLAAVDCYTWVFGENLIGPGKLLTGTQIFEDCLFHTSNRYSPVFTGF